MKKNISLLNKNFTRLILLLCLISIKVYSNETGPDRCGNVIEIIGKTNHFTNPDGYTVNNATDNEMYRQEIYGLDFTAIVRDLPSAEYTISIFMAESYWSGTGQRVFNVYVEDSLIMENLDIYAEVGKDTEYVLNYTINYALSGSNDELDIRFETVTDNGKFNAIQISRNDSIIACGMAHEFVSEIEPTGTGNPFIQHMFTADPSAHVFEGKMYVYPSHDKDNPNWFDMRDYHVFSTMNLYDWEDHGVVLDVDDVPWATEYMWAPDCAYKDGWYYLYFPARNTDGVFQIGVATSQSPAGPFIPELEPIQGSFSVDPAVFIDDDGQAYMYFGGDGHGGQKTPWVAKMASNMKEFSESPQKLTGINYWFEACWVNKIDSIYYLSYSTGYYHPDYPNSSAIAYATSKNPMGPYTYQGVINGYVSGWTNHHSIVEYKGQWYFFYHTSDLSGGVTEKRSICADYLHFNDDGSIRKVVQTEQGIGSYDGLEKIEAENFSETVGATKHECNEGGFLVSFNPNDTIVFNNIDFMDDQFSFVDARISSVSDGGIIEIYNNSNDLLGEIHVDNTGNSEVWQTISSPIQTISGESKISLTYKATEGSKVNLNWIEFTDGDPSQIDEDDEIFPKEYNLSQNYPNPFNPSTKIHYSIPEQSQVDLKVFDVLGREVSVLVYEEKSQGNYKVEFDASDLNSGVYFYQLRSGNFIETKKMLLLK